MSLEFLKYESYGSSTASVGRDDLWYSINFPTGNYVDNAAIIDPKWIAVRNQRTTTPLTPPVILGKFDSLEEARAACDADLASDPPPA